METRENSTLDYIYVLVKWRKFIILFSFLVSLIAVGISLTLDKWYKGTAVVFLADAESGMGISAMVMQQFGGMAADFLNVNEEADKYLAILESRTAMEYIAEKFDLKTVYETDNMEETVRALRGNVNFGLTQQNAVYIDALDRDKQRASDMANEFVAYLDLRYKELKTEKARNNRIFIEGRRDQNIADIKMWEDSLNIFQEKYKVLSMPEQLIAQLETYSDMYTEFKLKEVEYDIAKINLADANPVLNQLSHEVEALSDNLRKFELSPEEFKGTQYDPGYYVPFEDVPDLMIEFASLKREVEVQALIFEFITQQFELAKFEEAKDTPSIQILDRAVPPERKFKPKRSFIVLAAGAFAFLFSVSIAFTREYFNRVGDSSPQAREKVDSILGLLGRRTPKNE